MSDSILVVNCQTKQRLELELPFHLSELEKIGIDDNYTGQVYCDSTYDTFGYGLDGYMSLDELRSFNEHYKNQQNDYYYKYMLLGRLKSDCDYFLGYGSRDVKRLESESVKEHLSKMKQLWKEFPEDGKPEWLTFEQLLEYEKRMSVEVTSVVNRIYQFSSDLDLINLRGFIPTDKIPLYGEKLEDIKRLYSGLDSDTLSEIEVERITSDIKCYETVYARLLESEV